MANKNKVATPFEAFKELNNCLDKTLTTLDEACPHFELAVLPLGETLEEMKPEQKEEFTKEVRAYTLMMDFLLQHPLLTVVKQIREESKVTEDDTSILAIKHNIKKGQIYRHYKGTPYLVQAVSKDSNDPRLIQITYQAISNIADIELNPETEPEVWSLPIWEFSQRITWNGELVNRFQYIPEDVYANDVEVIKHTDKLIHDFQEGIKTS